MDLNSSFTVLQNKVDRKYLKLKHKIFRKICKCIKSGKTHHAVKQPIFMRSSVYNRIMAKIIIDFRKLSIHHHIIYGSVVFSWDWKIV